MRSLPGRRNRWYVFASRTCAPMSCSCAGSTPFTVARVPTGMKTGVRTGPCAVWKTPARAAVDGSVAMRSKSWSVMPQILTGAEEGYASREPSAVRRRHRGADVDRRSTRPTTISSPPPGRATSARSRRSSGPTPTRCTVTRSGSSAIRLPRKMRHRRCSSRCSGRLPPSTAGRPYRRGCSASRATCASTWSGRARIARFRPTRSTSTAPTVRDFADDVVMSRTVEAAIRTLPPEERDALGAVTLFGMNYQEAALAFDVPVGTVKSRVFRARRTLAHLLDPAEGGA